MRHNAFGSNIGMRAAIVDKAASGGQRFGRRVAPMAQKAMRLERTSPDRRYHKLPHLLLDAAGRAISLLAAPQPKPLVNIG
jgi:hypothetical protein